MVAICSAMLGGSCEGDAETSEIPESLRGAYGRQDTDAYFPTLGLEVDVDTIRFSELTIKILAGKKVGSDTLQITEAELQWAKDDKPPRKCKGTIARQGSRLLLSLFKADSDAKCDSTLDGDWEAWAPVDAIPESMVGTYGLRDPYSGGEGITVEGKQLRDGASGETIELEQIVMFESRPNHLVVRRSKVGSRTCRGHINLVEESLEGELEKVDSGPSGSRCTKVGGHRWSVDTRRLPKGPITNGKVTVEIEGETVKLRTEDDQKLRCEQKIIRTATRNAADSGRDRIPVMGGEVLTLHHAEPSSGASACAERLDGLADAECEEYLGTSCSGFGRTLEDDAGIRCPTHIVIGEPEGSGRKVALLPHSRANAVCWELRDPMKPKG